MKKIVLSISFVAITLAAVFGALATEEARLAKIAIINKV